MLHHLLLLCAGSALAGTTSGPHWRWQQHPTPLNAAHPITLVVALEPRAATELEAAFLNVTDPSSRSYGQHKTFDEIVSLTRDDEARAEVGAWLQSSCGASDVAISIDLAWLTATAPKAGVESCLSTSVHAYTAAAGSTGPIVRAKAYTIPAHLVSKIATISSLTRFPDPDVASRRRISRPTRLAKDSTNV